MYSDRLSKIHVMLAFVGAALSIYSSVAVAQHKGIGFQAVIKRSDGSYPTASGLNVTLQVMSPTGACVLREEQFSNVTISNGYLNLVLGDGDTTAPSNYNPSPLLSVPEVMNNSVTRTGLKCVDVDNNILNNAGSYNPDSSHGRKLRLRTNIGGDNVVVDLNMRAVPFAVNSEKLNGKDENDFIQVKSSAQVTQSTVESFFSNLTSVVGGAVRWNGSSFESYDPKDGSTLNNDSVPGSAISDLAWTKLTAVPSPVGQISGLTCVNGKILKMISGAWACGDESGVGVENDPTVQNFAKNSAGAGLRVNGSNNLEVDTGSTSGKIVQLDGAGKISSSLVPTLGVSNLDFAGAMAVNSGVVVSNGTSLYNKACAADQVLSWTVANGWICSSVGSLVTATGGLSGNTPISTTANISTTQSMSAASGLFSLLRIYDGIGKYATVGGPITGFSNDYTLTLPTDKGVAGQVIKITGVSGTNVELGWDTPVTGTVTGVSGTAGEISVATGNTTPVLSLVNAGTAGSYYKVTTDAKGRVTSGQTSLVAADIPALDVSKLTSGTLPIVRGGTNSATTLNNNRVMISNAGAIIESAAITANRALASNASGIPVASVVTDSELGYLSGVSANIQTQLDGKASISGWSNNNIITSNGSGTLAALASTNNAVLTTNGSGLPNWSVISNDTFTQYALKVGRAGGQTLNGGTAASENLTLDSTSHSTKGHIILNGSGGNVGIGTTSPASKLDVIGPSSVTSFTGTTPLGVTVRGPTSTNDFAGIDFRTNGASVPWARIGSVFTGSGSFLHFGTSNSYGSGVTSVGLTIDPSGNVGIGTTSPTSPLQVWHDTFAAPATSGTAQSAAFLRLSAATGATTLDFGMAGTGAAWIQNTLASNLASNYPLYLNPNGGNVGIARLSASYALDVGGDIRSSNCVIASSGVIGGTCASDERLKTDIQPFKLGLKALEGVAPKYFRYNGLGGHPASENLELGVIAQDVEKTAPELVMKKSVKLHSDDVNETEIKIVNYNGLIYLVINSVKELYHKVLGIDSRVEALEKENAAKTKELEEIKARLERIEKSLGKN